MKIILLLMLLCTCLSLSAQTSKHDYEQVITYDYAARVYVKYDAKNFKQVQKPCLLQGTDVSFQLININPFAQKVEINGVAVSMTTQMPAQLANLFNIKVEAAKELTNTNAQVEAMDNIKNNASAGTPLKNVAIRLVADCRDYYDKAREIKEAFAAEESLIQAMADKNQDNAAKMTQTLSSAGIDSASIADLRKDFDAFEAAYRKVSIQYQKSVATADSVGEKDKAARIKSAQEQVEKDYEALEEKYTKTLANINRLFRKATESDSYSVKSLPMVLDGRAGDADEVEFDVRIDDKSLPVPFTFRVGGGIKVDYSVGPVANFIADHQYYYDTEGKLQQRPESKLLERLTPSVAAMMHVYPRTCGSFSPGVMFGINANFKELTDINLGFLVGASAVLGRAQKVIVSTGLSYAKVSRLKAGQYVTGNVYKDVKIEDVTESVLRPSWFLSISLSLAKRNPL